MSEQDRQLKQWVSVIRRYIEREKRIGMRYADPWMHRFYNLWSSVKTRRAPDVESKYSNKVKPTKDRTWKQAAVRMRRLHVKRWRAAEGINVWWEWANNKASSERKKRRPYCPTK